MRRSTRQFYDGEENCYIIDAKLEGNLGRYLNVSRAEEGVSWLLREGGPPQEQLKTGELGKRAGLGGR